VATPIEVVEKFFKAWEAPMSYRAAIRDFFTDDCVYENVGLTKSTGAAESIAVIDSFNAGLGFAVLKVDMVSIGASGNTVYTERVDHLCDAGGKALVSLRLMGILEVRNGRISAWRDYFDTVPFQPK
jgi:limonene-1,2-epoxide hydrolase